MLWGVFKALGYYGSQSSLVEQEGLDAPGLEFW